MLTLKVKKHNIHKVCAKYGVLLKYPTGKGFQWGHLKNGPYTDIVSGGNGGVF